jgi:hypothetical protein
LANDSFRGKAPAEVVAAAEGKLKEYEARLDVLEKEQKELS